MLNNTLRNKFIVTLLNESQIFYISVNTKLNQGPSNNKFKLIKYKIRNMYLWTKTKEITRATKHVVIPQTPATGQHARHMSFSIYHDYKVKPKPVVGIKPTAEDKFIPHLKIIHDDHIKNPELFNGVWLALTHTIPSEAQCKKYNIRVMDSVYLGLDEKGKEQHAVGLEKEAYIDLSTSELKLVTLTKFWNNNPRFDEKIEQLARNVRTLKDRESREWLYAVSDNQFNSFEAELKEKASIKKLSVTEKANNPEISGLKEKENKENNDIKNVQ